MNSYCIPLKAYALSLNYSSSQSTCRGQLRQRPGDSSPLFIFKLHASYITMLSTFIHRYGTLELIKLINRTTYINNGLQSFNIFHKNPEQDLPAQHVFYHWAMGYLICLRMWEHTKKNKSMPLMLMATSYGGLQRIPDFLLWKHHQEHVKWCYTSH